jgi:hypothetical protein
MKQNSTTELPTVAANAPVILNRAELCAQLPEGIAGVEASQAWRDFSSQIEAAQPTPALN